MPELPSFLQEPAVLDDSCVPRDLGRFSISHYPRNCESEESIPAIVFVVLGFLIVGFSLLVGLVIVRVQDARASRRRGDGDVEGMGGGEEEVFPPYYDEETLVGEDADEVVLDEKDEK